MVRSLKSLEGSQSLQSLPRISEESGEYLGSLEESPERSEESAERAVEYWEKAVKYKERAVEYREGVVEYR